MSRIARRRAAALLLVAGIAAAILALADTGPFEDPPATGEDRVAATVERLFTAASDGDFRTFCELLTRRARQSLRANAARLGDGEAPPCPRTMALTLGDALRGASVNVREVSVSGPHARVTASLRPRGEEPELRTVYLDELDDAWLVSDPG